MAELTLYTDFSDKRPGNRLRSSVRFLEGQRVPVVGESVHLKDDEGNRCAAVVAGLRGNIIDLDPDWNSFRAALPVEPPASRERDS
jgi:hypothetical protein